MTWASHSAMLIVPFCCSDTVDDACLLTTTWSLTCSSIRCSIEFGDRPVRAPSATRSAIPPACAPTASRAVTPACHSILLLILLLPRRIPSSSAGFSFSSTTELGRSTSGRRRVWCDDPAGGRALLKGVCIEKESSDKDLPFY